MITKREECLALATAIVTNDRNQTYGAPEDSFLRTARLWEAFKDTSFTASDVAIMLDLLKTARLAANPGHADSWIDKAGYAACGYEVAQREGRA